jgi:hypothetical protein
MRLTGVSNRWRTTESGAKTIFRHGSVMAGKFEYTQGEEIRDAFARHGVRYLFIGKSGAIILGFADTTQDADVYVEKSERNGKAIVAAIKELGFELPQALESDVVRGKDFVQLKNGPFDLDLIFAPDGIDSFEGAWERKITQDQFYVCHPRDIIASKKAANRAKDKESLPRLEAFLNYWLAKQDS